MAENTPIAPLSPDQLYTRCDIGTLDFKTTAEVEDLDTVLGQERALEAIRLGTRMTRQGYNLFVFGPPGTGKHSTVVRLLKEKAKQESPPHDWVYVNNFETPYKPIALSLPIGRGRALQTQMRQLIDDIRASVPAVFESEEYQKRRQAIEDAFHGRQEKAFEELRQAAVRHDIALVRTPLGLALAPIRDGEVEEPESFAKRPKGERERIQRDIEALQEQLAGIVKQIPRWDKERRDAARDLNREMTASAVGQQIDEIREAFSDLADVLKYLEAVRSDLIENVHTILGLERAMAGSEGGAAGGNHASGFNRYSVNLIVGDGAADGAPVVYEDHPTMANLIGRVEHMSHMGALVTDFTLIKPGALHRANGGYLILDALKLLVQPMAWDALKRNLKARKITIESLGQMLNLVSTVSLEPQPIPLSVKVVLCGESILYYLLGFYDPDFYDLFKVAADFDDKMPRRDSNSRNYARLIATMARQESLLPFDRSAVARVIEHGARLAGDAEKMSLRLEVVHDVLREADYFAREAGAATVAAAHIQQAIDAQIRRADKLREKNFEAIERRIVLIDTDGVAVGQVNGLSVIELGGFAFGRPTRITARVSLGSGKVIDIEREVELGGPIHSKGVLILSSLLASRFGVETPLSLSANLVFEQSYGGVEGDSASSAEFYALMSAIADVPLKQSLAVTGSVNQHGSVQAIGGANEKIEGFFDICNRRGLTGTQGVLIPKANVKHLMLRQDTVEACAAGKFHIYAIDHVDEGLALLTGRPTGERGPDGRFPEGTVNRQAEDRLKVFAQTRRAFAMKESKEGEEKK